MQPALAAPASYAAIPTVTEYVLPQKQAVKRHYGSHQYFTKRPWNVIQAYIERYTRPGDVVCDPYGGTGVTVIEALVLGRRGVYVDISEWATFLAKQIAAAPVDLGELDAAFNGVKKACEKKILAWWLMPEEECAKVRLSRWYPKDARLPHNADVDMVEYLFTPRQLLALSELYHHVSRVKDKTCRDLLRYVFSATLYMCNRTFISTTGRKESRGGSSIFSIYRYKVAKKAVQLNPWSQFSNRYDKLLAAKRETNQLIGTRPGGSGNARFIKGYAQRLTQYIPPESVDYIFTDPPYGKHIAYLDLTRMWDAWLGFKTTDEDREEETIEDGDSEHTSEHYKKKLGEGIAEMFRALKYDRWMSLVYVHREPAMWNTVIKAAEGAGFEYVNTVAQPLNVIWSMHKKKNPLTVLSGELILNFRKVRNPRTLAIVSVGSNALNIIKDSAELSIVQKDGATTDQIYADLIPKLLENGLLGEVSGKIGDVTPIMREEFWYEEATKTWHVKPGRKLGCHIPLEYRIRFYVTDYLNQAERRGEKATIDDIVFAVLPKLKNGSQPEDQKIMEEVRKIAAPVDGRYWALRPPQKTLLDDLPDASGPLLPLPPKKPESQYEHNEILVLLARLASAVGFACHVGKKEQGATLDGHKLAELSVESLPFLRTADEFMRGKVEQIDLIWLDGGRPAFAFEVEHSTTITSGLERFHELLKVDGSIAERLVIVAPKSRQKKMNQVLGSSHFIGAPMYMDRKVRYLWYSDVLALASQFRERHPTKGALAESLVSALRLPNVS